MQAVDDPAGEPAAHSSAAGGADDAYTARSASQTGAAGAAGAPGVVSLAPNATPTLASVIHTHGAPSQISGAARLDAVLADLPASGQGGGAFAGGGGGAGFDVSATTRPPTPSSQTSAHTAATPAGGLGVSAGLALGVTPSAGSVAGGAGGFSPSPGGQREESDRDREAQRQEGQELRKQVAVLHNVQQRGTAESMCAACAAIQAMVERNADAKQCASASFPFTASLVQAQTAATFCVYVLCCQMSQSR